MEHVVTGPRHWSARYIADDEARWQDYARWLDEADDAAHTGRHDAEWSAEQSHAGEFGVIDGFGEQRD